MIVHTFLKLEEHSLSMPNKKLRYPNFWQSYEFLNAFLGHICPSRPKRVKLIIMNASISLQIIS